MAEVEELIRGAFAEALRNGRERFNAKFAQAQLAGTRIDPLEFRRRLASLVGPVVDAVAAADQAASGPVTEDLYDLVLEMVARGMLGEEPRHPSVVEGWHRLLPAAAPLVARSARGLAVPVTNALVNLSVAGANTRFWIDEMIAAAPLCHEPGELLEAGKVLAWRAGLAHFREGALEACREMRPEVSTAALGVGHAAPLEAILARLEKDPWIDAASAAEAASRNATLRVVARVGAFRGFGGVFRNPPKVSLSAGRFVVRDDSSAWFLVADRFGATLHPAGDVQSQGTLDGAVRLGKDGTARLGNETRQFAELAHASSWASDGTTIAVTLPRSHRVHLVARQA